MTFPKGVACWPWNQKSPTLPDSVTIYISHKFPRIRSLFLSTCFMKAWFSANETNPFPIYRVMFGFKSHAVQIDFSFVFTQWYQYDVYAIQFIFIVHKLISIWRKPSVAAADYVRSLSHDYSFVFWQDNNLNHLNYLRRYKSLFYVQFDHSGPIRIKSWYVQVSMHSLFLEQTAFCSSWICCNIMKPRCILTHDISW